MPRRFFRQFTPKRGELKSRWYLRPFRGALADPGLVSVQRRRVVPAIGIGVFCAWIPLPLQFIAASLTAIGVRANVAVAALATLVTNPVTFGPMFYLAFRVGQTILGEPERPFSFEFSWRWFSAEFVNTWEPLLIGCFVLASASALLAVTVLEITWRVSVAATVRARRLKRRARERARAATAQSADTSRS